MAIKFAAKDQPKAPAAASGKTAAHPIEAKALPATPVDEGSSAETDLFKAPVPARKSRKK